MVILYSCSGQFHSPHHPAPLHSLPFPPVKGHKYGVLWHRKCSDSESLCFIYTLTLSFGFKAPNWWEQKLMFQPHLLFVFPQSFKFVHASKLAEAGFTEEVSSKVLSVYLLALELIASFFKVVGFRQKGKQVASQQRWKSFYISCTACAFFCKNNRLANDLAVYKTSYTMVLILILIFAWVGCFAILQIKLLLFIILNI